MKQYKFITPIKVNKQGNLPSYHYKVILGLGDNTPRLHTLVGRNFLPDYREGLHILHKEETLPYPEINYVENLYVGTHKDNMRDIIIKKKKIITKGINIVETFVRSLQKSEHPKKRFGFYCSSFFHIRYN